MTSRKTFLPISNVCTHVSPIVNCSVMYIKLIAYIKSSHGTSKTLQVYSIEDKGLSSKQGQLDKVKLHEGFTTACTTSKTYVIAIS